MNAQANILNYVRLAPVSFARMFSKRRRLYEPPDPAGILALVTFRRWQSSRFRSGDRAWTRMRSWFRNWSRWSSSCIRLRLTHCRSRHCSSRSCSRAFRRYRMCIRRSPPNWPRQRRLTRRHSPGRRRNAGRSEAQRTRRRRSPQTPRTAESRRSHRRES